MRLNRKLCASWMLWHQGALLRRGARRKFLDALAPRRDCSRGRSQQTGWTIALDAVCLYGIVHFNFHERSEFNSILTSNFTSETSVTLLNIISYLFECAKVRNNPRFAKHLREIIPLSSQYEFPRRGRRSSEARQKKFLGERRKTISKPRKYISKPLKSISKPWK